MRKPTIRIRPYRHANKPYFVVEGLRVNGKRVRKFFPTKTEAETWKQLKLVQLENEGKSALAMSDALRIEAVKCAGELKAYGKTLTDATRFLIDYIHRTERSCTVAELVMEFQTAKRREGKSDRYLMDLKSRLGRFAGDFGDRKTATVEPREIDAWLQNLPLGPQSRNNFRQAIHVLFRYAVTHGHASENPVAKTVKVKLAGPAPKIFTPAQVEALLTAARQLAPEILPALVLGLFAGLRETEMARLDWAEVDLEGLQIEVKADPTARIAGRRIEMESHLVAWLAPHVQAGGRVMPPDFHARREMVCKAARIRSWPEEVMRHSFTAHHLVYFQAGTRTARHLGYADASMLDERYRRRVEEQEADRYWNIASGAGEQ